MNLGFKVWMIKEEEWFKGDGWYYDVVISGDGSVYKLGEDGDRQELVVGEDVEIVYATGLRDKLGNMIYNGDYLGCSLEKVNVESEGLPENPPELLVDGEEWTEVEYDLGMGSYVIYGGSYLLGMENENHTIIGNKYENVGQM